VTLRPSHSTSDRVGSMFDQPRAVWAVAFACVIAFMGIGLVDPILVPIAESLDASPSQVSLLFTSYMAVTGVAMLITGVVSSRFGPKRTLLGGLAVIVVCSALAGSSDTIGGIVGFRAGWGLGNALFIATALATIVGAASGGVAGSIILYEAALGVGIAAGPLLGGVLGDISWRGPFYGVAVLMALAFVAIAVFLPPLEKPAHVTSLADPFRALRHRGLLTMGITALLYNFGFFTLLAYAPFPLHMSAHEIGFIFFGWGLCLAVFSVFVAPRLQRLFGTVPVVMSVLMLFAADLAVMALFTDSRPVLVVCVVVAGAFLGVNNTLVTQAVMLASPVERSTASAAYSFVRFVGGAIAPWLAGKLGETISPHVPFWVGAAATVMAVLVLSTGRRVLAHIDAGAPAPGSVSEATVVTTADA
jgi:MFS transporter, ACDE family, multidrug resistance protein